MKKLLIACALASCSPAWAFAWSPVEIKGKVIEVFEAKPFMLPSPGEGRPFQAKPFEQASPRGGRLDEGDTVEGIWEGSWENSNHDKKADSEIRFYNNKTIQHYKGLYVGDWDGFLISNLVRTKTGYEWNHTEKKKGELFNLYKVKARVSDATNTIEVTYEVYESLIILGVASEGGKKLYHGWGTFKGKYRPPAPPKADEGK